MSYPSDLTDDQWELLQPVFNAPGKRGRKHADDLRTVVDAMPYMAQTGCQWRYVPQTLVVGRGVQNVNHEPSSKRLERCRLPGLTRA